MGELGEESSYDTSHGWCFYLPSLERRWRSILKITVRLGRIIPRPKDAAGLHPLRPLFLILLSFTSFLRSVFSSSFHYPHLIIIIKILLNFFP